MSKIFISDRFQVAEDSRRSDESRWLRAYENYRGLYNKSIKFRDSEKSRVFVKITKTKVLAAFGQLVDVIFGTGKFPLSISETTLPEGERGQAYLDMNNPSPSLEIPDNIGNRMEDIPQEQMLDDVGYEGDGKVLKPGATFYNGIFEDSLRPIPIRAPDGHCVASRPYPLARHPDRFLRVATNFFQNAVSAVAVGS